MTFYRYTSLASLQPNFFFSSLSTKSVHKMLLIHKKKNKNATHEKLAQKTHITYLKQTKKK